MATEATVRRIALSLADASEQDHHGFPSFRVGKKIFATLPDDAHANVMLDEGDIRAAVRAHPDACEEQWWGKKLTAVRVSLRDVEESVLETMLCDAWERIH